MKFRDQMQNLLGNNFRTGIILGIVLFLENLFILEKYITHQETVVQGLGIALAITMATIFAIAYFLDTNKKLKTAFVIGVVSSTAYMLLEEIYLLSQGMGTLASYLANPSSYTNDVLIVFAQGIVLNIVVLTAIITVLFYIAFLALDRVR